MRPTGMRCTSVLAGALAAAVLAGCGDSTGDGGPSSGSPASPSPTTMTGTKVAAIRLPGAQDPVVLTRQEHARGGYQLHLYVELPGGPRELTDVDHNPVIPFVATDTTPATPVSADCTRDGFAVTDAQPTKPRGVMFGWDVRRTSYSVTGGEAVPLRQQKLRTSVPDAQLRKDMPELYARTMFAHC